MKQCSFNARGVVPIQATLLRGKVEGRLENIGIKEEGRLQQSSVLAQRAASEGPRWTRAVVYHWKPPFRDRVARERRGSIGRTILMVRSS
jgi:hypothetical protein